MGLVVSDIRFNNLFRPSQDLPFLLSVIDEPITIEIDFEYEDVTYATEDNFIILTPNPSEVDMSDTSGIIYSEDPATFEDIFVGDILGFYSQGFGYFFYTVIEKFSGNMIRSTRADTRHQLSSDIEYIFNASEFKGLKYYYSLVNPGGGFLSLIDGEEQRLQTGALDVDNVTPSALPFTGIKSWQIGSATVKGNSGGGGGGSAGQYIRQSFTITHTTDVVPTFLYDQYLDLLNGKKPDYFQSGKTLNYIVSISLHKTLSNPNGVQTITLDTNQSNVGWHNQDPNGSDTNYSVDSVSISDLTALDTPGQLRFGNTMLVSISVKNTTDTPFVNSSTKYIAGFRYLPEDPDFYQDNGYNQDRNFAKDYVFNTVGGGWVNGLNTGTDLQIVKRSRAVFVSSSEITIEMEVETGVDAEAILQQGDFFRYKLYVIVENHALGADLSDKVNLLAQVNEFLVEYTDTSLVNEESTLLIQHPYDDATDGTAAADLKYFPVDDLVVDFLFNIDFAPIAAAEKVKITKVKSELLLLKTGESDILLEDFLFSTDGFPIIGGKAQAIDFTQDRVFKIPDGEIRKVVSMQREYALDTGDALYYRYQYPFMHRWEYWIELAGILAPPADIFDTSLDFNGLNNLWHRYLTLSGCTLNHKATLTIEQNGETFQQEFTTEIAPSVDFEGNVEWSNHSITSHDIVTDASIISGGVKYLRGYEDVKIKAIAEKISGGIPSLANVGMVIWIEPFEGQGVSDIRRITSFRELSSNSWFKSTDTSNKTVVSSAGSVYTGEALIDYTKLPSVGKFTMYARLYEFYNGDAKQFEDGDDFEFEDGDLYLFEDGGSGGAIVELGTAWRQDFEIIQSNPAAGDVVTVATELAGSNECCFKIPVFGETVFTSEFKNDKQGAIFWWGKAFSAATISLQKFTSGAWSDLAVLTDNTYGTYKEFGFYDTIFEEKAIGYQVDWRLVLIAHGEGSYRVKSTGTNIDATTTDKYWIDVCLKEYRDYLSDDTVRIGWYTSGSLGSLEGDEKKSDFSSQDWFNEIRLPDALFWRPNGEYQEESVVYQNGAEVWTKDSQIEFYDLELRGLPWEIHRIIQIWILQSDKIVITDYNSGNPTRMSNKYVRRASSEYNPDYSLNSTKAPVYVRLKQAYQNFEHKRC